MPTVKFEGFGGLALTADVYGSADNPVVLLLHGGGSSRSAWRAAAQALADAGRHVICPDLRGHGDSAWPADGRYDLTAHVGDLRAILGEMSSRPVIVGTSVGGLIAMAALADGHESLASGLVVVNATPWVDSERWRQFAQMLGRHALGFDTLQQATAAANEYSSARQWNDPEGLRALLRYEAGRYFFRWDPRFLSGIEAARLTEVEAAARRITLPTLVMHGTDSPLVTAREIARFRELLPTAEFVDIEGSGHLVAYDRLETFNAVLLEFLERRIPRGPITFEAGSDCRTLRDALGCFSTGVVIATTYDAERGPVGLTVNSFTSLSLDPPLILVCLAKSAGTLPCFQSSGTFAVNVLHTGQQMISTKFSRRDVDRFAETLWEQWETGAPIISGSLASIECDRAALHDGGDHVVLIGRVRRARFEPRRDPLLYFRGKYRRLHFTEK